MFSKLLVANRGEIALRVMRTAKEMGIATVAVYSEADRDSLHVRFADEAYLLGPAASYLNTERVLEAAKRSGAQAVHPGYGFLAENAAFARAIIEAGLTWVGPHPDAIEGMGDKVSARQTMAAAGVPIVPGGTEAIKDIAGVQTAAKRYGLPLALKAAGGGGGKGLKIAHTADELETAFTTAKREASAYFKNDTIYAERYLENPKHIELQILADKHGTVLHVGERDCSLQRRHQKLWEETPPAIAEKTRAAMRTAGIKAARAINYDSVGTIECLVKGDDFYFLEMNTRIQVEHTVSEMVSGLDLIREQLLVAAGERLGCDQEAIVFRGHSIEARINAEDPAADFRPAPGTITRYREPAGLGVRVDSAAFEGYTISADYDSLIAKLIVWAPDRDQARARLRRAIDEFQIEGVPTTLGILRALIDEPAVVRADYGTATLERFARSFGESSDAPRALTTTHSTSSEPIRVEINDRLYQVRVLDSPMAKRFASPVASARTIASSDGNDVISPMHGIVVELGVKERDKVLAGQMVAVIEAMKMMNEVRAHKDGVVSKVHASLGSSVEAQAPLVTLTQRESE
ncbi:MAG: acetyl-CoA carboxylase biotin carboxylase subunit [Candidatus Eremiobacteraeota bacterium]|nr:acetyl-CoA carboxylase biotin carboxylase subunit [Candidatus Eremiobacteraeota bacterium]